jgi:hypothetical protein
MTTNITLIANIDSNSVSFLYSSTGKEFIRIGNKLAPVETFGSPKETIDYYFNRFLGNSGAITYTIVDYVIDVT